MSPTEFDMQTYQESLLDIFDEETQEDLDSEKLSDDDDDDNDDDKEGDGEMGENRTDENNDEDKEDPNEDKSMKENGAEEEEQKGTTENNGDPSTNETSTPPPSPNKAPPTPMHTDQAEDAQQPSSKSAPASPMHTDSAEAPIRDQDDQDHNDQQEPENKPDHDADSISLDNLPTTPAQEPYHKIPAQVTINVTDPGPDMACTLDHKSPGFVHKGAMQ